MNTDIIKVLREFGVVGVVTYVGGVILLSGFIWEQNFYRQITLGVVGIILIAFSIAIAFYRLRIQKEREGALIKMVEGTCNRLAEQLGKNLTEEQVAGITQKIRQTQRDLISSIVMQEESKK